MTMTQHLNQWKMEHGAYTSIVRWMDECIDIDLSLGWMNERSVVLHGGHAKIDTESVNEKEQEKSRNEKTSKTSIM